MEGVSYEVKVSEDWAWTRNAMCFSRSLEWELLRGYRQNITGIASMKNSTCSVGRVVT
jgi:hypothetical protein